MKSRCTLGLSLALVCQLAWYPAAAQGQPPVSSPTSVFTVDARSGVGKPGPLQGQPNDRSYDLAIVRFNDDGRARSATDLPAALDCIRKARHYTNGAVIVLFIHGWHHNAEWDDPHFRSFRQMLTMVAQRESERLFPSYPAGRRVVGVYIGWNGDPVGSSNSSVWTFRDRYETAERIGKGADLRQAVRQIVTETKGPLQPPPGVYAPPRPESPLALIGHSMGALMLQSVFLALLNDQAQPLMNLSQTGQRPVEVRRGDQLIAFPDLVLSVNSAADSEIMREIRKSLETQKILKRAATPRIGYAPPLLVTMTSSADKVTNWVWRVGRLDPTHTTDGKDRSLFTHTFDRIQSNVSSCKAKPGVPDFGQNWHCLRQPEPTGAMTPRIAIDLPTRERVNSEPDVPHDRYQLTPIGDVKTAQLAWIYPIPGEVISDHNDIFNSRAISLMIGVLQISGAVASLATDWEDSFER